LIHSTAIVDPKAELGEGVEIGAYSIIGPDVVIGDRCEIGPHVVIRGPTRMGSENRVFQFSSLGEEPQDKKYAGEQTLLEVGDRNTFREFTTVNRGTVQGTGFTRIGDDNWIMAYVHMAHDCIVGNRCILANAASLAGHVTVDDDVILGGFTLVHQFCRIGAHSFCSMGSAVKQDVAPYVTVAGNPAQARGLNTEGLRRRGFEPEAIQAIRRAYKLVFRSGARLEEALAELRETARDRPELEAFIDFAEHSERGLVR
jgi:UDP-N-acetylglucosamine acyltransferase